MHSYVRPNTHVALRLPSGIFKIVEITPNTTINIGKFGSFPANLLLGRPYYLTFELLDKEDGKSATELRVVPAAELHAEALGSDHPTAAETRDEPTDGGVEFDIVGEDGEVIMRSNRMTVDDPTRQALSMDEIEELKKAGTGSGKDIIAKIMASHSAIDEKTSFSLAKYTLRKSRKYLKRFTVFPLDVGMLTDYVSEKEAYRIMDLREESLGLVNSWANIHCAEASRVLTGEDGVGQIGGGRWLVVDDTGGLVTASLAEKMGILYPTEEDDESDTGDDDEAQNGDQKSEEKSDKDVEMTEATPEVTSAPNETNGTTEPPTTSPKPDSTPRPRRPARAHIPQMSAQTNTLTVVHNNNQPNLAHLKYFSFDAGNPTIQHPLYKHLKSISWLQLLYPEEDPSYEEPEVVPDETLATMKSSKRGNYYKKRRRWERTSRVADETRRGGFDGLVVASVMEPHTILKELVPLVRGGGRVVVYSPNVEPLVELCDLYSKERRTVFMNRQFEEQQNGNKTPSENAEDEDDDFPLNPTLLLLPTLQTSRARHWQVLPGRTHPMMTSKGGAEGYIFTGTRVIPAEGKVEARGNSRGKKRK
ncbi:Gcd10p-domain-containing protein, partial [Aaosphaeria arxii CBS 175.79]